MRKSLLSWTLTTLVLVLAATPIANAALTDNQLISLPLNESSGSIAEDTSGNNNDFDYKGQLPDLLKEEGNGTAQNATHNTDYLVNTAPPFNGQGDFTEVFIFSYKQTDNDFFERFGGSSNVHLIETNNDENISPDDGNFRVFGDDGTTSSSIAPTNNFNISSGKLMMIAFVRNTSQSDNADIYINGTNVATSGSYPSGDVFDGTTNQTLLASSISEPADSEDWKGKLYQYCMWNEAKSSTDLSNLWNGGRYTQCDGTPSTLSFINTAPSISNIKFKPKNPTINDTINSSANVTDADLDTMNVTVTVDQGNDGTIEKTNTTTNVQNGTEINQTFNCQTFTCTDEQVINFTYNATDGTTNTIRSNTITVDNPVTVNNLTITANPDRDTTINATSQYGHKNNLASNLTIEWTVAGTVQKNTTKNNIQPGATINTSLDCTGTCTNDDNINATFKATDPNNVQNTNTTNTVTINDTGKINFSAFEKVTNNTIQNFTVSGAVNQTTTNFTIQATKKIGNYTIKANSTNYLNTIKNITFEIKYNTTTFKNIQGFINTNITLNVTDFRDDKSITNYDTTIESNNTAFDFQEQKTASGSQVFYELVNGTYDILVENATESGTQFSRNTSRKTFQKLDTRTVNITLFLTNSINMTFKEETTNNLLNDRNITVELISDLEAKNETTDTGKLGVDALMPTTIEIRYDALGYTERSYFYHLDNQSHANLTLYLINNTIADTIITTNLDQSGEGVESVTYQIMREYLIKNQSEFRIVEMDTTDFAGEAVTSAELTSPEYKIRVWDNAENKKILTFTDGFEITSTTLEITLDLGGISLAGFNEWRNITFDGPKYNNATKTWNANYTDNPGLISPGGQACLTVYKTIGVENQRVERTCNDAPSASLSVNYNDDDHGSIAILSAETNTDLSTHVLEATQTFVGARQKLASLLGQSGAFTASILVYATSALFIFNPSTYVIGGVVGLIASFAIGLINVTWGATLSVFILLAMIIVFNMKT